MVLMLLHSIVVYRQEQKGKKEAAADRKKKVQLLSSSTELGKILSEAVAPTESAVLGEQERLPHH